MKPLLWMRAVRDVDPTPPVGQAHVLWALALRMSVDGAGYASERQLADDAGVTGRTVRRAIQWAISAGHLNRTRRGHRLGDGSVSSSQWLLVDVSTGHRGRVEAPVDNVSTGHQGPIEGSLNRTGGGSQPERGTALEVYTQEGSGRSHREPQGSAHLDADDRRRDRECIGDCGRPFRGRVPADRLCAQCRRERRAQLGTARADADERDDADEHDEVEQRRRARRRTRASAGP